jgi:ArsR family transcriptional regulator
MTKRRSARFLWDEALVGRLASLFRALSDTHRLMLLAELACCSVTKRVCDVASCCPVDLSVVSRHLAAMREAGILSAERRGKEVHYAVNVSGLCSQLHGFADVLERCCVPKISRKKGR